MRGKCVAERSVKLRSGARKHVFGSGAHVAGKVNKPFLFFNAHLTPALEASVCVQRRQEGWNPGCHGCHFFEWQVFVSSDGKKDGIQEGPVVGQGCA